MHRTNILIVLVACVIAGAILTAAIHHATPWTSDAVASEPVTVPTVTYETLPTPETRELVEWAVGRYVEAGLQLPDLTISFPTRCDGLAGRYLVGRAEIELCHPNRMLIVHELAHAWDDHVEVDRAAFLATQGLEVWYEQPDRSKFETGGEQLAIVVAWGLMDVDVMSRESEFPGQPVDEQRRFLPGVNDSEPARATALFEQLTGVAPLSPTAAG